jgi:RNA polymerase sigma-70 factor, ECF subfamily
MSESKYSRFEEHELIQKAKNGDREAFGELYIRHMDLIYRYIRSRVTDKRDAEDSTETVFLQAFQALPRYVDRGVPFTAFLYSVARNVIVDHYRKHKDEESLDKAITQRDTSLYPEEELINSQRLEDLNIVLSSLRPDYQEVIRLRIHLNLSTSTTAIWMGKSEGAIRILLYRALKAMKRIWIEDHKLA